MADYLRRIVFGSTDKVEKGWGHETQIVNIDPEAYKGELPQGYSGKLLVYTRDGAISSMHFHTKKHETFFVAQGEFQLFYYNPDTAEKLMKELHAGDKVIIPPFNPHQLFCVKAGTIIEFATHDYYWDNYRVGAGDSQKK